MCVCVCVCVYIHTHTHTHTHTTNTGHHQDVLQKIFEGRSVGTLFTRMAEDHAAPHVRATEARAASRELVTKPASERRAILESFAKKISKNVELILSANQVSFDTSVGLF